jgi:hypothetical protein
LKLILSGTPDILIEVFCGFPQRFQASIGIVRVSVGKRKKFWFLSQQVMEASRLPHEISVT